MTSMSMSCTWANSLSLRSGMTLSRYINQYRLAIAKDLLIASKLSVAQIAVKVGYQNQSLFLSGL